MNVVMQGKIPHKYESIWRDKPNERQYDDHGNIIPYPKRQTKEWNLDSLFVGKLEKIQNLLEKQGNVTNYPPDEIRNCLINPSHKNVSTKMYNLDTIHWEDSLIHYIDEHNIKPSDEFITLIMNLVIFSRPSSLDLLNIPAQIMTKHTRQYIKLDRNQIAIMDALMEHGGQKPKYQDSDNPNLYRYSEHSGLLDFDENGLERVIISAQKGRVEEGDEEIFLPENMLEAVDFEYLFHTHPPTPKPGGRVTENQLYEFPSVSDLVHFIQHHNEGTTQGSIIIAPEGAYIIHQLMLDDRKIKIKNYPKFERGLYNTIMKAQKRAIKRFGRKFSENTYYSVIAQDGQYLGMVNDYLRKFKLVIDYYPRRKDTDGNWIIDNIYIPVAALEPKR